jgi:putative transposase
MLCGLRRRVLRRRPSRARERVMARELLFLDTTVIRLLNGTRAYLHAAIDNCSRPIVVWRVAETFARCGRARRSQSRRDALRDDSSRVGGLVENVNAQVDDLVTTGVLHRLLTFTELKFSNSMIESWWCPEGIRAAVNRLDDPLCTLPRRHQTQ